MATSKLSTATILDKGEVTKIILDKGEVTKIILDKGEVTKIILDKGEVTKRVIKVIDDFENVEPEITTDAHFEKDLGLNSLNVVEIVMALEEEFGINIPDEEADKIDSVKVAVDVVLSHLHAK